MVKRIDALTEEQKATLPVWRDKWIQIGLSTEPADRAIAEAALRRCYTFADLDGEKLEIEWVDSPKAMADKLTAYGVPKDVWRSVYHGGQFWAPWPAFESFFREVCGLELEGDLSERGKVYASLVASTGPMVLFRHLAICCERPAAIRMRNQRLHGEGVPAIEWRDGLGIYAWDGMVLPKKYVCDPVTAAWIDAEDNAEHRRVLLDRMGVESYLKEGGAEVVHEDVFGKLVRKPVKAGEPVMAVFVTCPSSGRRYTLGVHPEIRPLLGDGQFGEPQEPTARNAVASTFGLRGEEYAPSCET